MNHPSITVWSLHDSPRLRYVLDWLLKEQLGFDYDLTNDAAVAGASRYCIAYGYLPDVLSIEPASLLQEQGVSVHTVVRGSWNGLYTLYHATGSTCTIPFDLFSGIFYLLSRYEEYLDFVPDKHGRYPHSSSVLSIDRVLERPVVDEWIHYLHNLLTEKWQLDLPRKPFRFLPTYDIDIAWSYRHKGGKRFMGAALKELLSGRFSALSERIQVATGNRKDPYDAFEWMQAQHERHGLEPVYFILAALQVSAFDKNISPDHPAMQRLIRQLQQSGTIGIHPSYFTKDDPEQLRREKIACEKITGGTITDSRQHFIRLFFPATYRQLIAAGIQEDYSMGYSTALGFRAGTSHSFYWYDLEQETATGLHVHPFCFMDTTAHFDLGLNVDTAFEQLKEMRTRLVATGGSLITVFHNFSLGTDPEWNGWAAAYATFLAETTAIAD